MSGEEDGCPHGMGDRSWCSVCLGKTEPKEPETIYTGSFRAKFRGTCVVCDCDVDVSDLIRIRKIDGDTRGVLHDRCYEGEP